jgi:hypothetical protein
MRLLITAAVAAFALVAAGTTADAKAAKAKSQTFNISCPALAPVPMKTGTCKGTRASCQTKHQFCYVQDQKAKKKAHKKHAKKKHKK